GFGQVVLEAGRMLAVLPPLEDPGAGQGAEPGRERIPRRPGAAHHLIELAVAEEDLPHGQQRPLLADDVQGAGYGASPRFGRETHHTRSLPRQLDFWTYWRPTDMVGESRL